MKKKETAVEVKEINGTEMILHQGKYLPVQNAKSLANLRANKACWDLKAKMILAENGWISGDYTRENAEKDGYNHSDFELGYTGNPMFASFVPGVAFIADSNFDAVIEEQAVMTNTLDDGFHYIAPSSDKNGTKDLGPVTEPVIVGNSKKPYGLFVPFNNEHAMKSGTIFLASMIDNKNPDIGNDNTIACINALNTMDNGEYTYEDIDSEDIGSKPTPSSTLWG